MKSKLIVGMFLVVFLIASVSAWDWDNGISYESEDKVVVFENAWGLPLIGNVIAKAELTSHEDVKSPLYVMPGEDRIVMTYEIENYGETYINGLKDFEIINMYLKKEVQKDFKIQYAVYKDVEVNNYVEVCEQYIDKDYGAGRRCTQEISGTHIENKIVEWKDMKTSDIPEGNLTIAIVTDVKRGDKYDGIITLFGKKIERHAVWTSSLEVDLISWFKMDAGAGSNLIDSVGFRNASDKGDNSWVTNEIINNATHHPQSGLNLTDGVSVNTTYAFSNGSSYTWASWVNTSSTDAAYHGVLIKSDSYAFGVYAGKFYTWAWPGGFTVGEGSTVANSSWNHIAVVVNGTTGFIQRYINGATDGAAYYWNGDKVGVKEFVIGADDTGSNQFVGDLDEMALWNRTLLASEIDDLWNDGIGITYAISAEDITATQSFPEDDFTTSNGTVEIGCNFTITESGDENITSATIWVFDSSTNLDFTNTTGDVNFKDLNHTWNTSILSNGVYKWSCGATRESSSVVTGNRTFTVGLYSTDAETFVNTTTEGSIEFFGINITIQSGKQISIGDLVYNNTAYGGVITSISGDSYSLTREVAAPMVTADTNTSFFWNIVADDGSSLNSTLRNQTVLDFAIDDCSGYNETILNYTLKDEESKTNLNGIVENTTIEIDLDIFPLDSTTPIVNYSTTFYNVTYAHVCVLSGVLNETFYSMDVTTRYTATLYANEYHNLQNFSLSNNTIPQNISLYSLKLSDTTDFLITFKDETFLTVENALIDITRRYVGDGVFRSVEIPKTDEDGRALGHFDTDNVIYTMIVSRYGVILATFENIVAVCEDPTISDCKINLNAFSTGTAPSDFDTVSGLRFVMPFDEATRTVTTTFSTLDGSSDTVSVNATQFTSYGNQTICSDVLTSSSGTLTCTIPESFGNTTVIVELYNEDELIATRVVTIKEDAFDTFGYTGIVMLFMLVVTLPLMMITSLVGMIVAVLFGFIIAAFLNIYTGGSVIGVGSTILWLIVAGGILVWKIMQEGES